MKVSWSWVESMWERDRLIIRFSLSVEYDDEEEVEEEEEEEEEDEDEEEEEIQNLNGHWMERSHPKSYVRHFISSEVSSVQTRYCIRIAIIRMERSLFCS